MDNIVNINIENWDEYFEIIEKPICDTTNNKIITLTINHAISLKEKYRENIIPTTENKVMFSYNYTNNAYEYELIDVENIEYNILGLSKFNKGDFVKTNSEYVYFEDGEYDITIGVAQWFGGDPPSITLWDNFEITEVNGELHFN